jgi:membrane protease YdiL (CAAX protease family)
VRIIYLYLKEFLQEQFRWRFFLPFASFLAICFTVNYRFDFKATYIGYGGEDPQKYLRIFLFYLFPLLVTLVLYSRLGPNNSNNSRPPTTDPRVWALVLFAVLSYTFAMGWTPFEPVIFSRIPPAGWNYTLISASFLMQSSVLLVLVGGWWLAVDRGRPKSFYGFTIAPGHLGPYMVLAGLAIVLAFSVSLLPEFSRFYPMSGPNRFAARALNLSPLALVMIWEGIYVLQFVVLELFFRGFLVIGLSRLMGAGSIWVMASMYVFIHFSKPPLEAFASIFAGILLGVLAYRTRSILGGIILHITIALAMDLFALMRTG